MGVNATLVAVVVVSFLGTVYALKCYQCGMYNDGVGSITPCLNESHTKLVECPKKEHVYCIKYISEGSTVKDCVPKCTERENWHSMTYCCNENGCNGASMRGTPPPGGRPLPLVVIVGGVTLLVTALLTTPSSEAVQ